MALKGMGKPKDSHITLAYLTKAARDEKKAHHAGVKKHPVSSADKHSAVRHATVKHAVHHEHKKQPERDYLKTRIDGFDDLFEHGIPTGSSVLVSGGAGSGKTLLSLHIIANATKDGKKCLFMSFEESERRIREHMEDFGWDPHGMERNGHLKIQRLSIFDIRIALGARMAKSEGELLIDVKPVILPKDCKPDIVVVDSLTAIASAFAGKESYRSYIEQLFRYFESLGITSFLVTETTQVPSIFSPTGVEEFLADGVIVLYNVRKGDIRESAIEVLKMRGTKHLKKVVAMRVVSGEGIKVYPDQEVFEGIDVK